MKKIGFSPAESEWPDLSLILLQTVELNAWDCVFGLFVGLFVSFAASVILGVGRPRDQEPIGEPVETLRPVERIR